SISHTAPKSVYPLHLSVNGTSDATIMTSPPKTFPTPSGGASLLLAFRQPRTVLIVGSNTLAATRAFAALEADASVVIMAKGGIQAACEEVQYRANGAQLTFVDMDTFPSSSISLPTDRDIQSFTGFLGSTTDVSLVCITDTMLGEDVKKYRSRESAEQLFHICRARNIPINITDIPDLCDFTFASTHRVVDPESGEKTPLQLAVVTNGQGCRLSGRIRREIVINLPKDAGTAVAKVGKLRRLARGADSPVADDVWAEENLASTPNRPVPQRSNSATETELESVRRRMKWVAQISEYWSYSRLAKMTKDDMLEVLNGNGSGSTSQRLSGASEQAGDSEIDSLHALSIGPAPPKPGRILLVGSGPGHPSLLTMATHNALTKHADLVLSDKLVPEAVLAIIPSNVEVRIARKFPGNADGAQNEMMEAAVEAAKRGLTVVRLKQGDPTVYGRAGEEVLYFRSRGFESVIIPGVSSVLAGPVFAGIPVTQRGAAESFIVCTGVGRQGKEVKLPGYVRGRTLVILMGVARLNQVLDTLQDESCTRRDGVAYPSHTPIAIVERASMPDQRVITSTLADIAVALESSGEQRPPGMIVVGWSVLSLWESGDIKVLDDGAEKEDAQRVQRWLNGRHWRVTEGFDNGWEMLRGDGAWIVDDFVASGFVEVSSGRRNRVLPTRKEKVKANRQHAILSLLTTSLLHSPQTFASSYSLILLTMRTQMISSLLRARPATRALRASVAPALTRPSSTAHGQETFESFTERYVSFFQSAQDLFEVQRGLNNCFAHDLVPAPAVVEEALRAARRVNDYSTAVRIFEGIREKVENKQQYQAYLDELKPVREELVFTAFPASRQVSICYFWSFPQISYCVNLSFLFWSEMADLFPVSRRRSAFSKVLKKTRHIYNDVVKINPAFDIPPSYVQSPQRPRSDSTSTSSAPTSSRRSSRGGDRTRGLSPDRALNDSSGRSRSASPSPAPKGHTGTYPLIHDAKRHLEIHQRVHFEVEHPALMNRKHRSLSHLEQIRIARLRTAQGTAFQETENLPALENEDGNSQLRRIKGNIVSRRRERPKSEPVLDNNGSVHRRWSIIAPILNHLSTSKPSHTTNSTTESQGPLNETAQVSRKDLGPMMEQDTFSVHTLDSSFASITGIYPSPTADESRSEACNPSSADELVLLDQGSGIRFGRGSAGQISQEELARRSSFRTSPSLALVIGSPPPALVDDMHEHAESLPSFVLTIPTPQPIQSPVFVPQSPFTIENFVEASQPSPNPSLFRYGPSSGQNRIVPLLPRCDHPREKGPDMCRECETQMLACKVWFQESDGGRRQTLREPFVKPGESNAVNRAVMEILGMPSGSPADDQNSGASDRGEQDMQNQRRGSNKFPSTAEDVPVHLGYGRDNCEVFPQCPSVQYPFETVNQHSSRRLVARGKGLLQNYLASLRRKSIAPSSLDEGTIKRGSGGKSTRRERPTSFLALGDHESGLASMKRTGHWRLRPISSLL
ncbi:hypothetical protein EW146_g854, partial [Bondarzewia mesenterica]